MLITGYTSQAKNFIFKRTPLESGLQIQRSKANGGNLRYDKARSWTGQILQQIKSHQ